MWQNTLATLAGAPDLVERAFARVPTNHRHVEPASWEGIPGEYGAISLRGLIHFLSSHDHQHLACLDWLLGRLHSDLAAGRR